MTQTTRRLRETSVVIVDSHIPEGMTIAEYRRSRERRASGTPRRWFERKGLRPLSRTA